MEILTVKNLNFAYPLCDTPAVSDVNLTINSGDFVVLAGGTGSGKTTLLRLLKPELTPKGDLSGQILLSGTPVNRDDSCKIGYVMQSPDEQIVTDKVYSELAFGLENAGLLPSVIAGKIAEIACYFGIEDWYDKDISTLSGGQKQLLSLASVMVMNPEVLILDEPTSQLDPIAASNFINTLHKLNTDFSLTIIIAEHRLEELITISNKLVTIEKGSITACGTPREILTSLADDSPLLNTMPAATRLFHKFADEGLCPLTINEGRAFMDIIHSALTALPCDLDNNDKKNISLQFKDVYFRYEKSTPDVLQGVNLTVYESEIFCLLGGNGSGKSTLLNCATRIRRPYSGTIRIYDKKLKDYTGTTLYQNCLSLLPQDVQTVFLRNTVREELEDAGADTVVLGTDMSSLLDKHPYDLSGGEQQLVALSKVLAKKPRLILMDEPTKGLDVVKKEEFVQLLYKLKENGVSVLIVTHDVEFAAECADRCALLFRGRIVSSGTPRDFFSENTFYTTAISRITKGYLDKTVTLSDIRRRH